jgi:hypothetical protein
LIVGATLAVVAVAIIAALSALLGGGGSEVGDTTAALRLTTEEIALARTLGDDTSQLAASVEDGRPTSSLVGSFESSAADATGIAKRATGELDSGDPGGGAVRAAARNLSRVATEEAEVASSPAAPGATGHAREAKRSMEGSLAGIAGALGAMRVGFIAEGDTEVAETVKDSIARLRGADLTGPFDALIRAL